MYSESLLPYKTRGNVKDMITNEEYDLRIKPLSTDILSLPYKYAIYLHNKNSSKKSAYIYFYFDENLKTTYFIGMKIIKPYLLGKEISNVLMESYHQICDELNITQRKTMKQRKPLTTLILKKYGYEPSKRPKDKKVLVLEEEYNKEKNEVYLYIPSDPFKKHFLKSKIFRNENHKIVTLNEIKHYKIIDLIYLNTRYILEDIDKFLIKRETVRQRFNIDIGY